MLFNIALFSSLLLVLGVPAVPFKSGSLVPSVDVITSSQTVTSENWAGALLSEPNGTFDYITGTVTVPVTASGSDGDAASIWVGIDGVGCPTLFQTGVILTIKSGQPVYSAWYEMFPAATQSFDNISISAGDTMRFTISTSLRTNSGTARVENLSNGQWEVAGLNFPTPLCGRTAEWIVEDFMVGGEWVSLANFGMVTFTDPVASGYAAYDVSNAAVVNMMRNNSIVTDSSIGGEFVAIVYIG